MDDLVCIRGNLYQIQRISGSEMAIFCLSTGTEIQRISVNNNENLCYTKFNVKYYDLVLVYHDELTIYSCINQDIHHFSWVPTLTIPLHNEEYNMKLKYDFSYPYFISYCETCDNSNSLLLTLNDIDYSVKYLFHTGVNEENRRHVSIAKLSVENDYLSIVTINENKDHMLYIIDLNSLYNLIPSKYIDDNDDSVSIYSDGSCSNTMEPISLVLPTHSDIETNFNFTMTTLGSAEINHLVWKTRNNNISSLFFTLNNNYDHIKIWSVCKNDPALLKVANQESVCTIDTQLILEIPISHLVLSTPIITNNERVLINWIEQVACTSTEFEFYGAMKSKESSRTTNKSINQTEGDWLSIIYPINIKANKKQNARSGVSIMLISKQDNGTISATEVGAGILLEADNYSNKYAIGSYVTGMFRSNVRGYPVAFDIITKNIDVSSKNKSSPIILRQSFVVELNDPSTSKKEFLFTMIKDNSIQVGAVNTLSNQMQLVPMYNLVSNNSSVASVILIPINQNGVYQVHIDRINCSDKNKLRLWTMRQQQCVMKLPDEYKFEDYSLLDCAIFAGTKVFIRQAISLVQSNQLMLNTTNYDNQRICLSLLCLDDQRSRNQSDASDTTNGTEATYNLEVSPSPLYGLGVRLEGRIHTNGVPISCIQSFRKHPTTGESLHIEKTGIVQVGDEVLAVNGITLRGLELAETIKTIRNLIQISLGKPMKLVIARKITAVKSSALAACSKKKYRRWTLERQVNIPINSTSVHVSSTPIPDGFGNFRLPVAAIILQDDEYSLVLYLLNPIDGVLKEHLCISLVGSVFYNVQVWSQDPLSNQLYITVMSKSASQFCLAVYHMNISCHDDIVLNNDWVINLPITGIKDTINWVPVTLPFCCGENKKHCFFINNNCECNNTIAVLELSLSPNSDYINNVSLDITYSKLVQYIDLPVSDITMNINSIQWIDDKSIYITTSQELYIFAFENGKYKLYSRALCDSSVISGCAAWPVYPGNHMESSLSKHSIQSVIMTKLEENSFLSRNGIREAFGLVSILSHENDTTTRFQELFKSLCSTLKTPIDDLIMSYRHAIQIPMNPQSSIIAASVSVTLSSLLHCCCKNRSAEDFNLKEFIQYLLTQYKLDAVAVRALLLLQMNQVIGTLTEATSKVASKPIVNFVTAANMLVSSSQNELLYILVERPWMKRIGSASSDNALNDIADAMMFNISDNEFDVLDYFCKYQIPFWCHDMNPLFKLLELVALQQFKVNKCAIDVFLELVLLGKMDTLLQFCKVDKSESSQQLLKLLKIYSEYTDSSAILRKNAFALMRLGRYKHAAATFLLIKPPLVEEACSILAKQYGNPCYALLISRLVECKPSTEVESSTYNNGCVLGPVSRNLIDRIILPGIKEKAVDTASYCADDAAFAVLCSMWLQDTKVLATSYKQFAFFSVYNCSETNSIDNILSSIAYCSWCLEYLSHDSYLTKTAYYTLVSIANTYELHDIVFQIANNYKDAGKHKAALNSYLTYCRMIYDKYTSLNTVKVDSTAELVKPIKMQEEAVNNEIEAPISYKASGGFNFSGNSKKPAASASNENMASALDWF